MIVITDDLERKLKQIAGRKNQTVTQVLETFAEEALSEAAAFDDNPLLSLAQMASESGVRFNEPDVALRSRELLESHFAKDLIRRTQDNE